MICSMTAFARCEYRGELGELAWEIRSVNHRYLEVGVRLPEELRSLEPLVRERLAARLSRGKIDCALRYKPKLDALGHVTINERLANQLLGASQRLAEMMTSLEQPSPWDVLRWPGVIEVQERDLTPVQAQATDLLEEAIDQLVTGRRREGQRLVEVIAQRCANMRVLVAQARVRMPQVIADQRLRLRNRLQELLNELDETRLEQEIALLAQRMDVDEEMDRLTSHLGEVEQVLRHREPVGRRLDFLMQELNREANTLSSKSVDFELTRTAVEMKVMIEQMREQIQNVE